MSIFQQNTTEKSSTAPDIVQYLSFLLNDEYYAFPISHVDSIISMIPVIPVPEFPDCAKGILNIRGLIVPIIDTRLRFHMPEAEYGSRTCIVTVKCRDMTVGFIVDTVNRVLDVTPGDIMGLPKISEYTSAFINGVA